MSGPIVPPLEVTEVDGAPDGRPITKIVVSNGDLSISGRTATIDTTGSGGTPGGSDTQVQYNNAGAFGGDAGFVISTAGGGTTTRVDAGNLRLGLGVVAQTLDHDIPISAGAAGEITLSNNNDGGGTMADMQVNIIAQTATDDPILHLYNTGYSPGGKLHLDGGTGDFVITSGATAKDLDLKVNGAGQVEVQNTTTDTVSVLSIMGNGTGDARLDMQNASERVWVVMDENKKLKIQGGSGGDTFIFDVSSATGGIQFPDGTSLISAEGTAILSTGETGAEKFLREDGDGTCSWQAAGGGDNFFAVETPDPTLMANSEMAMIPATTMLCGYGGSSTQGVSTTSYYFPFIAPHSGDVASVTISVSSSGASTFQDFGIYDNTDGFPDTLIGKANIDVSSTGEVTQSSLSATITLVKGTMYWLGWSRESGANFANLDCVQDGGTSAASFGLGVTSEYGMTSESNICFRTSASGALPATVTLADLVASNRDYPIVGLAW